MQKLDHSPAKTIFPSIQLIDASPQRDSGSVDSRRLLVIVSDSEFDAPAAARRVLEVASAFKSRILFLGLCTDAVKEPSLHRQLVTLSAMIRDEHIPFDMKVESGRDWLTSVRSHWQEGDMLVCISGQRAGTRKMLLGPLLQSNFNSTVYVLDSGIQPEHTKSNWISTLLAWTGSICILLGFFWLQINIDRNPHNWASTVILIGSIPVEGLLIWVWNSLFG